MSNLSLVTTPKRIRPAGHIGHNKASIYACIDCGAERRITDSAITTGERQRCPACGHIAAGLKIRVHNDSGEPLYKVWSHIKKEKIYWEDYLSFKEWSMSKGYKKGLHPLKKDSKQPFSPDNLVWVKHLGDLIVKNKIKSSNKSGYTGVCFIKGLINPWRSSLYYKGANYHLGSYATARKAASVRNLFIIEKGFPHRLAKLY